MCVLRTSQTVVHPNESIEISYNLSQQTYDAGSCWIGLIPVNITSNEETVNDAHDVSYFHVSSEARGSGTLQTSRVGAYRVKCFANDSGGAHISTLGDIIYVSYIKPSSTSFNEHDEIQVSYDFSSFDGQPEAIKFGGNNWVGIIPASIRQRDEVTNDSHDTNYFRMPQKVGQSSMVARRSNTGGDDYELRVFPRDDGGQQVGVGIPITIRQVHVLCTDVAADAVLSPGQVIEVSYNLKGQRYTAGSCWIGLVPASVESEEETVNDAHDVDYFHVQQADVGKGTLRTNTEGTYCIKCFADDSGGALIAKYGNLKVSR